MTTSVDDLPRVKVRGKEYILESLLYLKRPRTAYIYREEHGYALIKWPFKKPYWACKRCDDKGQTKLFVATATSNATNHLWEVHRVHETKDGDFMPEIYDSFDGCSHTLHGFVFQEP